MGVGRAVCDKSVGEPPVQSLWDLRRLRCLSRYVEFFHRRVRNCFQQHSANRGDRDLLDRLLLERADGPLEFPRLVLNHLLKPLYAKVVLDALVNEGFVLSLSLLRNAALQSAATPASKARR